MLAPAVHAAEIVPPPTAMPAQPMVLPPPIAAAAKNAGSLDRAEDKLTDSVKNVVNHINATDDVTLDDLNSARQAVAKIDALIDIEKRLNELDKLRSEREGKSMSPVPASMLTPPMPIPPGVAAGSPVFTPQPVSFHPSVIGSGTEVSRILGSGGRYSAIVKLQDGQTKTVRVGDHIGTSRVTMISAAGVELEQGGKTRLIAVKNVEAVFGHAP